MLRFIAIFFLILIVLLGAAVGSIYVYLAPEDAPPKIAAPTSIRSISTGEIIGYQGRNDAHAWLGIPYAQAPEGDLRWKAPRPALAFDGRREMLAYGDQCPQLPAIPGSDEGTGIVGSEDCLVLNVWAPAFHPSSVPDGDERLPVMFWIHGGGNTIGSGGSDQFEVYDGSMIATQHNVVVVSVNYRMGPLGWFAHDALMNTSDTLEDASGNFGTLDLIAALVWVQNNIEVFGGDPGNVTIFGESAGGSNVLSMMASPLAKGLFHRAIVQSGAFHLFDIEMAQAIGVDPRGDQVMSGREMTAQWLVAAGQSNSRIEAINRQNEMSDKELAVFLRGLSPVELYDIFDGGMAGMIWMPLLFGDGHVLPKVETVEIFENPGSYNQVPVIIGSNRDESALFMAFSPDYVEFTGGLPTNLKNPAGYRRDVAYGSNLWRANGVDSVAEQLSLHNPDQVFTYRFDADDWRNLGFVDLKELIGAAHAIELFFVFGYFTDPLKLLFPDSTFEEVELLSNAMMSYWAEFAWSGNPGTGRDEELEAWLPWRSTNDSGHYLVLDTDIDAGIRMEQGIVTRESVIAAFMEDDSHTSQDERCLSYRSVFFMDFEEEDYASIGCQ